MHLSSLLLWILVLTLPPDPAQSSSPSSLISLPVAQKDQRSKDGPVCCQGPLILSCIMATVDPNVFTSRTDLLLPGNDHVFSFSNTVPPNGQHYTSIEGAEATLTLNPLTGSMFGTMKSGDRAFSLEHCEDGYVWVEYDILAFQEEEEDREEHGEGVRRMSAFTPTMDTTFSPPPTNRQPGGSTRIVGGTEVSPRYRLGYQALVQACHKSKCNYCGGTVLHHRFVITAAHCLHARDGTRMSASNSRVRVVVGEHNICDNVNEGGQVITASQVYVHPNYGSQDNDIAILKLPQDIIFNSHVRPACLPTSPTASYSGQSVTVSGWGTVRGYNGGQTQPQQPQQCKLKETTLKVQTSTNIECRRILQSDDSSRLCAFAPRTDSCQGDSGGPLTLQQGGRTVLLGVTSYGYGCADSRGVAGIYARVQGFLPWIAGIVPGTQECGTATPPNGYSRPGELKLVRNTLLATLPAMGKEWTVSFLLYPTSFSIRRWQSIVHLTNGGNKGKYGDRIPSFSFHPSKGLQVSFSGNGRYHYKRNFKPSPAPVGQWTKIVVSQTKRNNIFFLNIAIGATTFSIRNDRPAEFTNVRVYASDPWHRALPGSVKDLTIQSIVS